MGLLTEEVSPSVSALLDRAALDDCFLYLLIFFFFLAESYLVGTERLVTLSIDGSQPDLSWLSIVEMLSFASLRMLETLLSFLFFTTLAFLLIDLLCFGFIASGSFELLVGDSGGKNFLAGF